MIRMLIVSVDANPCQGCERGCLLNRFMTRGAPILPFQCTLWIHRIRSKFVYSSWSELMENLHDECVMKSFSLQKRTALQTRCSPV